MSKRNYDREFKLNAVKLYRESGKSLGVISEDLGVPLSTFSTWVKQYEEQGDKSFPGSGVLKPCNEEVYRLRRELADMKQERDILKKAVAIFSKAKG